LKRGGELLALLAISDTTTAPEARTKFQATSQRINGWPLVEQGPKASALLDWIYRMQEEEQDPALKVLIFTEFVPTQAMLAEFLQARGMSVGCLNGSMGLEERKAFSENSRRM
jgi:superfamily II DNA/RNA helicase